ncbi:MAG: hypothetical protein J5765_02175 [Clostridia bacterium]|nr:hypothetical protein [Clostridia bacterium]
MSVVYGSITDTIKEIVGGFDTKQMIAIGVALLVAILLGFFIGACATYASGVRKGKLAGAKDAIALAKEKAEEQESGHRQRLLEEKQRGEALRQQTDAALSAKQAELEQAEKAKAEAQQAALAAEQSKAEAERLAREAELSREETARSLQEAEQAARAAEEEMRALRESDAII